MAKRVRTLGREAAGWSMMGLAIVLFPVPFVPTLLVIAALVILSARYEWAEGLLVKARQSFPRLFRTKVEPVESATAV